MNAKLTINDVEVVLGHKGLADITWWLEDKPANRDLFHELAKSECSEVLVNLVDKENLLKLTTRMLIEDSSLEVMRAVLDSSRAREHMTRRDLESYIAKDDCEILTSLANNLTDFTEAYEICEPEWLCEKLIGQPDPAVRYALAENEDTPEEFLERLADDDDADVAGQAAKTLAELREEEDEEEDEDPSI